MKTKQTLKIHTLCSIFSAIILLLIASSASATQIPKSTFSDINEYYAVIIGVEKFNEMEYPNETYIDETAIIMYNRLINSSNWKEENIKLLLNENATKENIYDTITNWLDENESENDVVLIFYSDHGWKIPFWQRWYGHAYVFTYNSTKTEFSEDKITDKEFDVWLDELESKHITVILETCYSGRMLSLRQKNRVILTAGGKYLLCPVDEDESLKMGIFGYFILQGFDGTADINNDGWITAEESFRYARWPTFRFSFWQKFPFNKNLPMIMGPQLPYIYDRHIGSIPLINLE